MQSKKIFLIYIVLFFFLSFNGNAEVTDETLVEGMVSYWDFDENTGTTAYDSHGSNDGTIYGATWTTSGKINNALSFDASSEKVVIANESSFDFETNDSFSISFWANKNSYSASFYIAKQITGGISRGWIIFQDGDNFKIDLMSNGHSAKLLKTYDNHILTGWHHYVVSYGGNPIFDSLKLYIDGSEVTTVGSYDTLEVGESILNSVPLEIGNRNGAFNFDGKIDEPAIWNRELNSTDVSTLYNIQKDGYTNGSYPFEALTLVPTIISISPTNVYTTTNVNITCSVDNTFSNYNITILGYNQNDTSYFLNETTISVVANESITENYVITTSEAHDTLNFTCQTYSEAGLYETSAEKIVQNTAPTQPDIYLLNETIKVNQTLYAQAENSTDIDGDSLTYYYRFYDVTSDTELQTYSTDNTYVVTNNETHHDIRVYAKAYDGYGNSTEQFEDIYVSNLIPTIPLLYLSQVSIYSNQYLLINKTENIIQKETENMILLYDSIVIDSDEYSNGQAVNMTEDTSTIEFYARDTLEIGQEYHVYVLYKGNIDIKRYTHSGLFTYNVIYFTSNEYSSYPETYYYNEDYNHDIMKWAYYGSFVYNNIDYFTLRSVGEGGDEFIIDKILITEQELDLSALNSEEYGSIYQQRSTDVDNDSLTYYYKFVNLNNDEVLQEYSTNETYVLENHLDNYTIRIYSKTFDEYDYSDESYIDINVVSYTPDIDNVEISGLAQGQDVSGYCNVSDYENNDIQVNYYWYSNDVLISSGNTIYQEPGIINVPNLSTDTLFVGDNIRLSCSATDSFTTSDISNSNNFTLTNHGVVGYSNLDDDSTNETEIGDEVLFDGNAELYNNVDTCIIDIMSVDTGSIIDTISTTTTDSSNIYFNSSIVLTDDYALENKDVKWRVWCNDTYGNSGYSDYEYFTVYDFINPEIDVQTMFVDNDYVINNVFNTYLDINVTYSDYNLFYAGVEIECELDGEIYSWEYTDIGEQSYTYTDSFDISEYEAQKCNITFISVDDHTANEIPDYNYMIDNNTLLYQTDNGANVAIQSISPVTKISTDKLTDRYNFEFKYDEFEFIRQYLITTDEKLYYRGNNSIYPGHFVVWNDDTKQGNWIDFALPNSEDFYYIINKIDERTYEIILIHKVLMVDNVDEYNFRRNEINNILERFINLFRKEYPLNSNEIKPTDIEYVENYDLMTTNDIINRYNLQMNRTNDNTLLVDYGINNIKFNSLGGTNSLNLTYDFDIAGVFNLTSYDSSSETNFTNYNVYVENIENDSISFNYTFNVSSNNYIINVTRGNYTLDFSHPNYISKEYTKSMPENGSNLVDVLYNTSETEITFNYQNIKSGEYINNYTIYVNNTNLSIFNEYNVSDTDISLTLYANMTYNVTFVKDGYINTSFEYSFDYGDELTITEDIGYYANISYVYEHNFQPFDFNDTFSSILGIHCDDKTITYDLINETANLVPIVCDYEKFVVSTSYLSEIGIVNIYRKIISSYEESLDLTIYLIDGVETPYVYSSFSLDDLMGNYENPIIIVKKKIDIGTVVIHSELVGPAAEMGVFLLENEEYIIEIHSDNLPVRIIGAYNADVGEDKSISLYDVNFKSTPTGFYEDVKFRIEKINYSNVDNALFEYSDISNGTNKIQFKLYLGSLDGDVIYESEMYSDINEIGPIMVPLTEHENDTIVGQIYIEHDEKGILTPSRILNKTWNILLRIKEHVGQAFLNWFFIILLSVVALYTNKDINIASLVLVAFGFIFTLFGWFNMGYGIIGLVLLISLIEFLLGGNKK